MPNVLKADGSIEPYDEGKILSSIKRAGIPSQLHSQIIDHVKQHLYDKIPTSEIYKHIEEFFSVSHEPYAQTRYSLKRAIMELGPTGFPFEVYVSKILNAAGFNTEVGVVLIGKCVRHEIDIIARNKEKKIFVECKFHNKPGTKSEVHVSLYTKARFDDLAQKHNFSHALLVTNTKITSDALSYAQCENVQVMSWSYPEGESLRDLVEKYKLFPITQLSYLSFSQKQELFAKDIVLISQICSNPNLINQISLPSDKKDEVVREASAVCNL